MEIQDKYNVKVPVMGVLLLTMVGCIGEVEDGDQKNNNTALLSISIVGDDEKASVNISPTAITCHETCSQELALNQEVIIQANDVEGYSFDGWEGSCSGIAPCTLIMSGDLSVTANYSVNTTTKEPPQIEQPVIEQPPVKYTLSLPPPTNGTYLINDEIVCTGECVNEFNEGSTVKINALPNEGYVFNTWANICSGNSTCRVELSQDITLSASFDILTCPERAEVSKKSFDLDYPYTDPNGVLSNTYLTDFTVKESSGFGVDNFNITTIFPLAYGKYFHHGDFYIEDSNGTIIPAQFNVLNRWWAKDNSLRHIQASFSVDIDAYTEGEITTGIKAFKLYHGTKNIKPENAVCVVESASEIKLNNGLIELKVEKDPLIITTPAGQLKSLFTNETGVLDESFNHDDISFEIEENGQQRTVVKIGSLTKYNSPTDIKHGWSMRLYFYADSKLVNLDFQIQNSALSTQYSAPLYFQALDLTFDDTGSTSLVEIKAEVQNEEKIKSGESGYINAKKLNVYFKDLWQRFPQGLKTTDTGTLHIELYPQWSKQFLDTDFTTTELYWIDDMRHTYQEILLDFSSLDANLAMAKTFQQPPVAVIPQEYYRDTSVTLSYGGYMDITEETSETGRTITYMDTEFDVQYYGRYKFGQDNYGLDLNRKRATSVAGSLPYQKTTYFSYGNPKEYYDAQRFAKAELNVRPQWIAGYTHDEHQSFIQPTANPYGGSSWRDFKGHYVTTNTREYIDGTNRIAHPRDDQHAWFYHMEHAYLMSGNKWIRDWYNFMGEFKLTYLNYLDPYPDKTNRAEAHNICVAVSAHRVTGNKQLEERLESYVTEVFAPTVREPHYLSNGKATGDTASVAAFQQGFLMRSFIELYTEFEEQHDALKYIGHSVEWNTDYGQYSYYKSILDDIVNEKGIGTGTAFVDVATWYSMITGDLRHFEHARNYVETGIGGGFPYGFSQYVNTWNGQYEGQIYYYYINNLVTK